MTVINGFFIAVMLLFLAYSGYRLYKRRRLVILLSVCAQLFAISIAVLSFFNDIQTQSIIQVCFLLFGVIFPFFFLVFDYNKMMKKVREQGVYEGFIEPAPLENDMEKQTGISPGGINPILKEKQVAEIAKDLILNKDEVVKNIKKSLNHAHSFLSKKDYDDAYEIYNTIIKIVNNCPGLFFNHANICYLQGNYSEAVNSYKKVLELNRPSKESMIEILPDKDNQEDNGRKTGTEAANAAYKEYETYYNMGNAYFKSKKYEKAVQCFEKTIELNPVFFEAQENKVYSLMGMGESQKAIEYFKKIADQEEKNYKVHYFLTRLLSDTGKFEEAEAEISKCISIDPACTDAYEELGRVFMKQNKLKEALETYENLIKLKPEDHTGYYKKGSCCYKMGMKDEAVEYYKKSVELMPDNYRAYYNMAIALDETGNKNEAVEAFNKAIILKPYFVDAYNNLGILLSTMGRNNEALEIYEEGVRRNPEEYSLHLNMGITLSEAGRYKEAVTEYKNALEIKPDEHEINYHLGAAFMELRNYNDAIDAYKKALKIKPSDSELFYNIAMVYSLLGKYDISRDNLRKAIELNESLKNDARINRAFDGMRGKNDFKELVS